MTKTYIRSFVVMKYAVILPLCIGISFLFMMLFFKTHAEHFRLLSLLFAALMLIILLIYMGDKQHAVRCLTRLSNWKAYDDSTVIGHAFLLDERMLIYDRKLYEIQYADLKTITATNKKKHTTLIFNDHIKNRCSSLAQAQRLAAFLHRKNEAIQFHAVVPEGDGNRLHIEAGENR